VEHSDIGILERTYAIVILHIQIRHTISENVFARFRIDIAVRNSTVNSKDAVADREKIRLLIYEQDQKAILVYDVSFRLRSRGNISRIPLNVSWYLIIFVPSGVNASST
jgi:hypothetical protein